MDSDCPYGVTRHGKVVSLQEPTNLTRCVLVGQDEKEYTYTMAVELLQKCNRIIKVFLLYSQHDESLFHVYVYVVTSALAIIITVPGMYV